MGSPDDPPPERTTAKESFSGPAQLIDAAKNAARIKFGDRPGGWSRWLVEAITDKLRAENPELLASLRVLAANNAPMTELMAELAAAAERNPAILADVKRLLTSGRRRTRSAA